MYNHNNFTTLLRDLPDWFVASVVSFGQSSKISAGNEQEKIVSELFNSLGVSGIRASLGEEIGNETRHQKSKVDVSVWCNDQPFIAIDVKNGGANGTESAEGRSIDVMARVEGAQKKGFKYYVYLFTPQSSCTSLEHVDIAKKKLSSNTAGCKLLTASLNEKDVNLNDLCAAMTESTGTYIDAATVVSVYNKLNLQQPNLKARIQNKAEKYHRDLCAKAEKQRLKAEKKITRKRS